MTLLLVSLSLTIVAVVAYAGAALLLVSLSLTIVAVVAYAGAALLLAREIVYPRRARPTRILGAPEASEIRVSANPLTRFEGTIGLLYDEETKLAVLSPGVRTEEGVHGVLRKLATPLELRAGTDARACGNVFQAENVTGTAPVSVDIQTTTGSQPAWLFPGAGPHVVTWIIHIHGMLAGRDSALRTVRALSESGFTSLVVSYPGDGEALNEAPRPSTLGQTEWQAVDDAVGFARSRGATNVFLVGWSLGATIAFYVAEEGAHQDVINGLLLVSPVVSWARSIRHSMSRSHIPPLLAKSAVAALSSPVGSRFLGLDKPLDLPEGLPSSIVPTLIIHSRGDQIAPFAASSALAASSDLVELEEFPSCPHAMEWNTDPQRFSEVVQQWIIRRSHTK